MSQTGKLPKGYVLHKSYRVDRNLGKGGFGAVYEATTLGNKLMVAIKEMSTSGLDPNEIVDREELFKKEATILQGLIHPHIPRFHDIFEEANKWYLVMDFIQGDNLATYLIKRGGKVPLTEALEIGMQLCDSLSYLHTLQPPVIFRDLKPANIMRRPDGKIVLIDFGIARFFTPGKLQDTFLAGSPGYSAPEQYGTAQTSPRSDIYSLGATLHQLVTGVRPSNNPFLFKPISTFLPNPPRTLQTLLDNMTQIDDTLRIASALQVKQRLQNILQDVQKVNITTTLPSPPFQPGVPPLPTWMPAPPVYQPVPQLHSALTIPKSQSTQMIPIPNQKFYPIPLEPTFTPAASRTRGHIPIGKILFGVCVAAGLIFGVSLLASFNPPTTSPSTPSSSSVSHCNNTSPCFPPLSPVDARFMMQDYFDKNSPYKDTYGARYADPYVTVSWHNTNGTEVIECGHIMGDKKDMTGFSYFELPFTFQYVPSSNSWYISGIATGTGCDPSQPKF